MDIEQLEALALSEDRAAAVGALLPGTPEHDYWRAVFLQHGARLDEVDVLLAGWNQRHDHNADDFLRQLQRRQLLLRATADLAGHAEELRREANVVFDDRAEVVAKAEKLPSVLDPATIDEGRLLGAEIERDPSLRNVTDYALSDALVHISRGDVARRRMYLSRLKRANIPGLIELIAADLKDPTSAGFGQMEIHGLLTLPQLEELSGRVPNLRSHTSWVAAVVLRQRALSWVDVRVDARERDALLNRLWVFATTLGASFNSLKAQILYHRLEHDRARGTYDRALFLAYLDLPRKASWVSREWLGRFPNDVLVSRDGVSAPTGLDPIGNDESLVRDYLSHFLLTEDGSAFQERVRVEWLEQIAATARLLAGAVGEEAERYARVLGASQVQALRDHVEIDLAPQNPAFYGPNEPVALEVDVKNVPELEVKVFRINTLAHFLAKGDDVETGIDLDGMVARGDEWKLRIDAPPIRRTRQRIELPACAEPGTYIIDLIGNGRASRALVRKGVLSHTARISAAGPVVTVLDGNGAPVPNARIWLGGREYTPRADGGITIPFSTRPGRVVMLLVHGEITQRAWLDHPAETVVLRAGLHLERESLIPNQTARILCRPTLTIAGAPAPIALVESAVAEISVTDQDGASTSRTQPIALHDDRDSVIELNVPEGTAQIAVFVRGRVRVVSTQSYVDVRDGSSSPVNSIHGTSQIASMHLATSVDATGTASHVLHVVGKTGEPIAGHTVAFALHPRSVRVSVHCRLQTDGEGRIALGSLVGIDSLTATLPSDIKRSWRLSTPLAFPQEIHTTVNTAITLPPSANVNLRPLSQVDLSLEELRGTAVVRDRSMHLALTPDGLRIEGLPVGEFRLSSRELVAPVAIIVTPKAAPDASYVAVGQVVVELSPPVPFLRRVTTGGAELVLRVANASRFTRLHVIATRFRGDPAIPSSLYVRDVPPAMSPRTNAVATQYVSGRDVGDEYRYVLERRGAAKRPGTMLEKPSVLLNPRPLRTTTTTVQHAKGGEAFRNVAPPRPPFASAPARAGGMAMRSMAPAPGGMPSAKKQQRVAVEPPGFTSVDFLVAPAVVIDNLAPDESGEIRIPLAELGSAQLVTVLLNDPRYSSVAEVPLAAAPAVPRDLRLRHALDPAKHYAEDRAISAAPAGTTLVTPDVRTGKLDLVDTVARAHQLLVTLTANMTDAALRDFSFVKDWPSLDRAKKCAHYSKYACHELNLFLWRKDPAFFTEVVRPHLAHKRDKMLVDLFLLGEDLSSFLEPWRLGRLNTLEKVLLGASLPAARDGIARLVGDQVELIPPDPERDARLVSTLLGATALESPPPAADGSAVLLLMAAPDDEATGANEYAKMDTKEGRRRAAPSAPSMPSAEPSSDLGFGGGGAGHFAGDMMERERSAPLYRGADKTEEWAETNWHQRTFEESVPELIPPNRFWRDLARSVTTWAPAGPDHPPVATGPFLSPYIGDCTSSFAESMCALAFLDLPFVAEKHDSKLEDTSLTVTTKSHALAARTHIVELAAAESAARTVLIGQSYLREDDRWEWVDGEQREKYVTGEMTVLVVYLCKVVVTNPTSTEKKLDLLLQIPRGALPVSTGFLTRTVNLHVAAYGTSATEYAFYFPRPGRFTHFPAHVTKSLVLQAAADARELEVVLEPRVVDLASWSHVSQIGSLEEVIAFLERTNIGRIDLGRIAWRMHDKASFERITALLTARHVYDDALWRYALAHRDRVRTAEWLRHQDAFLQASGPLLEDALGDADPIARGWLQHLEYAPLINARAHQLGSRRQILNSALLEQYRSFLEVVALKKRPSANDLLASAHYLLCMDRIDEALAILARVDGNAVPTRMQLVYLTAYCACYQGDLVSARTLATPWATAAVDRWRNRFAALLAMIDEAEGATTTTTTKAIPIDPDSRDQRMAVSAAEQPSLTIAAASGEITLEHHNLASCQLRFYGMDIELLFSRQPFVQGDVERFSFIEPGLVLDLPLAGGRTVLPIPDALRGKNLVIEAIAPGIRASVAHYAHDLTVQVVHTFGQVKVLRASTQTAIPATYVKVYGRQRSGEVTFFKDGYTDLRGRFDYATLSTDDLDRVDRFALLVASDTAGATILEAAPPSQ